MRSWRNPSARSGETRASATIDSVGESVERGVWKTAWVAISMDGVASRARGRVGRLRRNASWGRERVGWTLVCEPERAGCWSTWAGQIVDLLRMTQFTRGPGYMGRRLSASASWAGEDHSRGGGGGGGPITGGERKWQSEANQRGGK